jgi:hypothetical protein
MPSLSFAKPRRAVLTTASAAGSLKSSTNSSPHHPSHSSSRHPSRHIPRGPARRRPSHALHRMSRNSTCSYRCDPPFSRSPRPRTRPSTRPTGRRTGMPTFKARIGRGPTRLLGMLQRAWPSRSARRCRGWRTAGRGVAFISSCRSSARRIELRSDEQCWKPMCAVVESNAPRRDRPRVREDDSPQGSAKFLCALQRR